MTTTMSDVHADVLEMRAPVVHSDVKWFDVPEVAERLTVVRHFRLTIVRCKRCDLRAVGDPEGTADRSILKDFVVSHLLNCHNDQGDRDEVWRKVERAIRISLSPA